MSHPDPLFDPDNAYKDDDMATNYSDYHYDYHDDFYEGCNDLETDEDTTDETWTDDYDDSMDGDHESGLASAGWGTDEDYGFYGDDYREDFHADDAVGCVDYNEDGPYDD
jgi:hypothetical protein